MRDRERWIVMDGPARRALAVVLPVSLAGCGRSEAERAKERLTGVIGGTALNARAQTVWIWEADREADGHGITPCGPTLRSATLPTSALDAALRGDAGRRPSEAGPPEHQVSSEPAATLARYRARCPPVPAERPEGMPGAGSRAWHCSGGSGLIGCSARPALRSGWWSGRSRAGQRRGGAARSHLPCCIRVNPG